MRPLKRLFAIGFVLLLTPGLLFAQKKLSDWNNVEKLKSSAKIIVTTKKGMEFAGEKRQVTDDTLFLETALPVHGTRIITLERVEIAAVRQRKSRGFLVVIGAAIGVAAGAAIGAAVYDHPGTDDPHMGALVIGALGGLIGGGTASLIPKKTKTIYLAP